MSSSKPNPAATGGIWTNANLEKSLDWAGESALQESRIPPVLDPKSTTERIEEALSVASPSEQSGVNIEAIKTSVSRSIVSQLGGSGDNIRVTLTAILMATEDRLKQWVVQQQAAEPRLNTTETAVTELRGQMDLLGGKVDDLTRAITSRGDVENKILERAMDIVQAKLEVNVDDPQVQKDLIEMERRRKELERQQVAVKIADTKEQTTSRRRGKIW